VEIPFGDHSFSVPELLVVSTEWAGRTDMPEAYMSPMSALAVVGVEAMSMTDHHDMDQSNISKSTRNRWSEAAEISAFRLSSAARLRRLTQRKAQILKLVVSGDPSKNIATDLGISQRTVDNHRAAIGKKTGAKSLSELVHVSTNGQCSLNAGFQSAHFQSEALHESLPVARRSRDNMDEMDLLRIDMQEMQHRIKNIVAVVQSISRQSGRKSSTIQDFNTRFSARLSAYCQSIDLLVANDWQGMKISELVTSQLSAFGILDGQQFVVAGPEVSLTAEAAHSLGLALHELATNSIKYGSLSLAQGKIALNWSFDEAAASGRFKFAWTESGGPVVTAPTHQGFGRRMIEDLTAQALQGQTNLEFLPTGVTWTLLAPIPVIARELPLRSLCDATPGASEYSPSLV
jgi:two-component sensor histidine kinase